MPKIQGIDEITSTNSTLFAGAVPVGGIIAIHEVRFGLTSGVVLSGGFMLCDGAAIPPGQTLSGNTPDITGTKFLRGNTTSGAGSANNSRTLSLGQLPSHTHTHTGTDSSNLSHNHNASNNNANLGGHVHAGPIGAQNAPHSHTQRWTSGSTIVQGRRSDLTGNYPNTGPAEQNRNSGASNMPHRHSIGNSGINTPHNHAASIGTENTPHTHSFSGGDTGGGQAISITPQYSNSMFLIRVV